MKKYQRLCISACDNALAICNQEGVTPPIDGTVHQQLQFWGTFCMLALLFHERISCNSICAWAADNDLEVSPQLLYLALQNSAAYSLICRSKAILLTNKVKGK